MIKKGATDWNWGLCGACKGGHIETVKLLAHYTTDYTRAITYICVRANSFVINLHGCGVEKHVSKGCEEILKYLMSLSVNAECTCEFEGCLFLKYKK